MQNSKGKISWIRVQRYDLDICDFSFSHWENKERIWKERMRVSN